MVYQMVFGGGSITSVKAQLDQIISYRILQELETKKKSITYLFPFDVAQFPVCLCFVRGDRGGSSSELAKQVKASIKYWDKDSEKYIDIIFPGWFFSKGKPVFILDVFLHEKNEIESMSKYRYSGETDLLLLNYRFNITRGMGDFSFEHTIVLLVEQMIQSGRINSIDGLIQELINHAKDIWKVTDKSKIWEISDKIGIRRGSVAFWRSIIHKIPIGGKIYKSLRPFCVCDLRKSAR